jgi:hypothetical protein
MTDPQDDLEQRIAAGLRRWTQPAPREVDFDHEARIVAATGSRPSRLFMVVLGVGAVVAAVLLTLSVLNLGALRGQLVGDRTSESARPDGVSPYPSVVLGSPPEAITIDLLWENRSDRQYWFVIGDVREGRLTEVFPIAPCEKGQVRDVLIFWPDDVFWTQRSAPPASMDDAGGGIDFYTAKAARQWVLRIEAEDPPDDMIGNLEGIGPSQDFVPPAAPEALC